MSPRQRVSSKKVEGKNMGPFLFQLPFIGVRKFPLQPLALSYESAQVPCLLWRIFNLHYQWEPSFPHFCFQTHHLAGLQLQSHLFIFLLVYEPCRYLHVVDSVYGFYISSVMAMGFNKMKCITHEFITQLTKVPQ